eukprot:Phypoly_transcript_13200.p1 GENE.Phypoly_transcript_13200~~Phypoly_transcript_13200.p1  ORF type:complete len:141 (+),score=16.75 Phypoly_transcript_13200:56-478(+)
MDLFQTFLDGFKTFYDRYLGVYVLKVHINAMGGDTDYTLSTSGTQKMDRKSLPKLDMDKFWQEMGPTISSIIDNKTDGDRLVVHFETTCHPNFDIEVSMDGRSRSFHIYGAPRQGARLVSGEAVPQMYIDLFTFLDKCEI